VSSESKLIRRDINPPQDVILKGFTGEPLKLVAVFDRGDSIEVAKNLSDEPMPFHADCVFRFDAHLLAELNQAAENHDDRGLREAWHKATPFRKIA
jgi:hypothetical protein